VHPLGLNTMRRVKMLGFSKHIQATKMINLKILRSFKDPVRQI
jgi:hypothetical protein